MQTDKKTMKRDQRKPALLLLFLATVTAHSIAAETIPEYFSYLPPDQQAEIQENGSIFVFRGRSPAQLLLPSSEITRDLETTIQEADTAGEMIGFVPYPNEDIRADSGAFHLQLYNTLRSLSSMEGIEYFSASRNRMRTLFVESYFIADTDSKEPIPDPLVESIPANESIFALQEDLTFGSNIYEINYQYDGRSLRLNITNENLISYAIFPAIAARNLNMVLMITPLEDGLAIYEVVYADPLISIGLKGKIQRSLSNRLIAINNWFLQKFQTEF